MSVTVYRGSTFIGTEHADSSADGTVRDLNLNDVILFDHI